jgi:hypothetical protein
MLSRASILSSNVRRSRLDHTSPEHPDYPLNFIEEHVIEWLEGGFAPPTYSREQFEELDRLTEAWVEDHKRQVKAARKTSRTRHSEFTHTNS